MFQRISLAVFLVWMLSTSSANALTVTRIRQVEEETSVDNLLASIFRGFAYKLKETPTDGTDLTRLKEMADRLNLEVDSMSVTLRDGDGKKQEFTVEKQGEAYLLTIETPTAGFDFTTVHHISQTSYLWATVRGYRLNFKQELEYNRRAGFIRLDLHVLSSVGRVTGVDFYFSFFEKEVHELTAIDTSLSVSACVPGRPCGLIHRIAANKIACKSDQALLTLDTKVREIATRTGDSSWLDLVPILGERAIAGVR